MVTAVPDVLARIVEHKQLELHSLRDQRDELELRAEQCVRSRRSFHQALASKNPAVIAEIKKASPSKGLLCADFHPARIAGSYQTGGAAALSVLTDQRFFQGSLADLASARDAAGIPVLRKDFTLKEIHVIEAAAHGADAILLIAAILTPIEMRNLRELAARFAVDALVEVHDEDELDRALDSGAQILGVNNRNLHTFEVTLDTSIRLAAKMPENVIRVSESGIHSAGDIQKLQSAGFSAFLVGEHLMKSEDPATALQCLLS
jgi:indole-3-glycerol phosphate synthase